MRLYVAYGSNLCKAAMRRRCPDARPIGSIMLTNARLVFRGVADLEYDPNSVTPCGVWKVSSADERALDRYEGVSSGMYYRDLNVKLKYQGERQSALLYLMTSEGIYPPSQAYVDVIRQGYRDFGLDESFLDEAIERSFEDKAPDAQTESRRARQRRDPATAKLVEMPEAVALKRLQQRQ